MKRSGQAAETSILVVEDEDSIRLTLRDYLTRKGFKVLVASDGVGAIKQLLDNDITLLLTDYRMDVLGGDYWMRFLARFCPGLKVLVTSGFLRPDFEIPFPIVYKPYDYGEIEDRITALLEDDVGPG